LDKEGKPRRKTKRRNGGWGAGLVTDTRGSHQQGEMTRYRTRGKLLGKKSGRAIVPREIIKFKDKKQRQEKKQIKKKKKLPQKETIEPRTLPGRTKGGGGEAKTS